MLAAPVTVMLVDADPAYREWARGHLEAAGFFVVTAAAHEAALTASRSAPSVCLIELAARDEDFAAFAAMKKAVPQARIVVLSGDGELSPAFDALKLGALGYLRKGPDGEALVDTVRAVLRGELALPPRLMEALIDVVAPQRTRTFPGERAAVTRRQAEVGRLLRDGLSTEEIASRLGLSPVTVRRHVGLLIRKLGAPNRAAAIETLRLFAR
jgi:two-component system nitrate/nitrite response regulator NarL